jgi:hypothetical protein
VVVVKKELVDPDALKEQDPRDLDQNLKEQDPRDLDQNPKELVEDLEKVTVEVLLDNTPFNNL